MKYLIMGQGNEIIHISDTIGYQENGNPLVDNGTLAIAAILVDRVVEVETVPDGVVASKYCYSDTDGFYENPNWVEPPKPLEEQVAELNEIVDQLLISALEG